MDEITYLRHPLSTATFLFSIIVALTQNTLTFKSAPVGPVAGGIMGCFLLLALGVYCYRHHVHRHSQYISTLPEGQRNSPLDNDFEDLDSPDDLGNGKYNFTSLRV